MNAAIHSAKTDDRNAALAYSGGWATTASGNYASGTGTFSLNAGGTVQYTFTGTGVKWYGVVGNDHGKADVYIDNVLDATIDLYTPHWAANTIVYAKRDLVSGSHTIKIVVRSDKNVASSNNYVEIDALEALVQPGAKVDDRASGISYSGGWSQISASRYYQSTSTYSTSAGAFAEYTFSGTHISWLGPKGSDHGKADVYVDNVLEATVDTYATARADLENLFTKSGLVPGPHTIKIVLRSDKNPASSDRYVEVDAFGQN